MKNDLEKTFLKKIKRLRNFVEKRRKQGCAFGPGFYKRLFDEKFFGIAPKKLKTMDDLKKFESMVMAKLKENFARQENELPVIATFIKKLRNGSNQEEFLRSIKSKSCTKELCDFMLETIDLANKAGLLAVDLIAYNLNSDKKYKDLTFNNLYLSKFLQMAVDGVSPEQIEDMMRLNKNCLKKQFEDQIYRIKILFDLVKVVMKNPDLHPRIFEDYLGCAYFRLQMLFRRRLPV